LGVFRVDETTEKDEEKDARERRLYKNRL